MGGDALRKLNLASPFAGSINAMLAATIGILVGASLFFMARQIEGKKARVLVEEGTGRRVVFRRSAGSLFFVPTRYWAFISTGLWLWMAIAAPNTLLLK